MGNGLEEFLTEAATVTMTVTLGEHVGKIKGKQAVIHVELVGKPGHGIHQIQQVTIVAAGAVVV